MVISPSDMHILNVMPTATGTVNRNLAVAFIAITPFSSVDIGIDVVAVLLQ